MYYSLKYSALTFLLFFFITVISSVNNTALGQAVKTERNFSMLGGYSFSSVKFLGKTPDSQTRLFTIGYQQRIYRYFPDYSFWYTIDLIPHLHYEYPKRDLGGEFITQSGFGLSPVGFLLTQESTNFFVPFIKTSGGIIYMQDEFPTDRSRRLNFTFDITTGANLNLTPNFVLSFGYKFHHISNAQTGNENPGLDSNILFLKLILQ